MAQDCDNYSKDYSTDNPWQGISGLEGDLIDFPCSPLFATIYAARGLTPQLPKEFPMRVTTPAPWEDKREWPEYDPSKVDIGENSPLWDNLKSLFPDWAALKAQQKKLDDERIKKDKAKRAAAAKKQLAKDKGIAAADKKSGGIYRTL